MTNHTPTKALPGPGVLDQVLFHLHAAAARADATTSVSSHGNPGHPGHPGHPGDPDDPGDSGDPGDTADPFSPWPWLASDIRLVADTIDPAAPRIAARIAPPADPATADTTGNDGEGGGLPAVAVSLAAALDALLLSAPTLQVLELTSHVHDLIDTATSATDHVSWATDSVDSSHHFRSTNPSDSPGLGGPA